MKLKMIISIVLTGVVIFLAFGFYRASKLTHIHINKKVVINADEREVFNHIKYLNNFPKWSPFKEVDPSQKIEVKGTDGAIGAQYHWEGNGGKDLGYQEIKKIEDLKFIGMECNIQKPFMAHPTFDYSFKKTDNGIEVTQDFNLDSGIVDAFFMGLLGTKKEMEQMNSRGLQLLKEVVERR